MHIKIAALFVTSFLFCSVLIPIITKIAKNKGLLTCPTPHKIDKRRISYFGGVAMFFVFLTLSLIAYSIFPLNINGYNLLFFLLATAVIILFGLYDDIKELVPIPKLIGQSISALILVLFVVRTQIIYLNPALNILISLLWIITIINAFNLLDILDGLAGGISLINIFTFFLFACLTNNHFVILISTLLMGVLIAFLRYNLPPAKILMGDTGSQFLGFSQAAMAISLSFATESHEVGLVIPVVILSVPLFDLFFVILMRMRQKKPIFLKSNDHFVFRMLKSGMSNPSILKIMFTLSMITAICALVIYQVSNIIGAVIFFILMGLLLLFGIKLSYLTMN